MDNKVYLFGSLVIHFVYTMQSKLKRQKLIVTSIILFMAFTYPIVSIANHNRFAGNIPMLFIYIFVVWIIGIVTLYRIADHQSKKPDE